jgi:predicted esterase
VKKQTISKARGIAGAVAAAIWMFLCQSGFAASSAESYISEIDGSSQPFGLYLPEPFDPNVPHPVVFHLHGAPGRWSTDFPMASYADANGWILVNPDGRGDFTAYLGVAQDDVFCVLDDLRDRYPEGIDENRIYVEGCSQGGQGASRLGFLYPDLFAAAAPVDGWYNCYAFLGQYSSRYTNPEEVNPRRRSLIEALSPLYIAENVKHLKLYLGVDTGDGTVPPSEGYSLHDRLDELGYPHSYELFSGGHCSGYSSPSIYDFFSQQVNEPNPKSVVLKANQLKYGSAYWVRIDRLARSMEFAAVEAKITGKEKDRVEVTANGLHRFTLSLTPELLEVGEVNVVSNGELIYTGPPEEITVSASLDESGSIIGWSTGDTLPRGLKKTAQIEGPIGHAYMSKFLLVVGTTSKPDTAGNRARAEQFAADWNLRNHAAISPVEDTSITEEDILSSNLILFGTADSNSLIDEISDLLPVRIWNNRIVAGANEYVGENYGLYMIFPNPLNPEHYVVIRHRAIPGWIATDVIMLPLFWPDYVVFDTNIVPIQEGTSPYGEPAFNHPDAWVEAGYFDQYWRLDEDEDGMDDIFEKEIIDADPDDEMASLEDVSPDDDFDGDGQDNRTECNAGTDGTDAESSFCALSVNPDPADGETCVVSWRTCPGRSYCVLWAECLDGPWYEIEELDPGDISDEGDVRTWTDQGSDPAMEGKKPGDCAARFYKVAAYR